MALFQVDIEKQLGSEFWSNRYVVDVADLNAANAAGLFLLEREQAFHYSTVLFTRYRASTVTPGDDSYVITPIGEVGGRAQGGSSLLPLFNAIRVDFTVATGRPSRKYYRGCLTTIDVNGAGLLNPIFDSVSAQTGDMAAAAFTVDVDGQKWLASVVLRPVGMRQLRRGSRRRGTPILPAA